MLHSARDYAFARQLDEYAAVQQLIPLIEQIHERLNIHLGIITTKDYTDDRQDTALTEAESRIADLEQANANLWLALAGFAKLQQRVDALAAEVKDGEERTEKIAMCLSRNNLWGR